MEDRRDEFLLQIYNQMFSDINRHILVVWQSVGVVVGAFAIYALAEKQIVPIDVAETIIVILCAWLWTHILDAGYWYNRNLAIIANIERHFLTKDDLKNIHYYFGRHRPLNRMIAHLRIQVYLAWGLALVVLLHHFSTRVVPGFSSSSCHFDVARTLPYLFSAISGIVIYGVANDRNKSYEEFISQSPGLPVDTTGIDYGVGHGYKGGAGG